ncbi:gliding motility-associated C-terminal domain-containing protein [uncultured Mucilaginibacter sp.]|uniref:gliding motility-associated C-terminal domain-containing protein n=1 Tax=uncultured Mucilaginibacter sp. TaxID=797541 RepID=UPI0025EFF634|nr:gliding motility-associated C-terminal domain-containing protein [uncultured Mucilaginibacter sp.]
MEQRRFLLLIWLFFCVTNAGFAIACYTCSKIKANHPTVFTCPTIITTNIIIQDADCHKKDGGIYGISGTGIGVHSYTWYDAGNNIVGTDSVLTNVGPGQYTLKMHDESKCPPVTAGPFTVGLVTGIYFLYNNVQLNLTNCSNSDGSITGMQVAGAVSYKWVNTKDTTKTLATTTDITNIPMGIYQLRAFNSEGCEADSKTYYLGSKTIIPSIASDTVDNATCGNANGDIKVHLLVSSDQPTTNYYIQDEYGGQVLTGLISYTTGNETINVTQLAPGTFSLIIGDPQVCLITLKTYTIARPVFALDTSQLVVTNDRCGMHIGSIGVMQVTGGTPNPPGLKGSHQHFTWTDAKGRVVSRFKFANLLGAGKYKVHVDDDMGCSADSRYYTVGDSTSGILPPVVSNIELCLPGQAVIVVKNLASKYVYRLYQVNASGDTSLLLQNTTGKFITTIDKTTVFYITGSDGTCESAKTQVTAVVQEPGVNIPSLFSPNHDGINDTWNITGLANYPGTQVNIYDRSGALIYTSVGYAKPFDGTRNGMDLPSGVYYYTIDLKKKNCGAASGSVTIVR